MCLGAGDESCGPKHYKVTLGRAPVVFFQKPWQSLKPSLSRVYFISLFLALPLTLQPCGHEHSTFDFHPEVYIKAFGSKVLCVGCLFKSVSHQSLWPPFLTQYLGCLSAQLKCQVWLFSLTRRKKRDLRGFVLFVEPREFQLIKQVWQCGVCVP